MPRVNYDELAPLYDEPGRDHAVDANLVAFLASTSITTPRILDIGCGTGKQLEANRRQWPEAVMVGLDRFAGMLRIARQRCGSVTWIQADGASLPCPADAFHYVTTQFAHPHVRNTPTLLQEIHRALTPGGRFVMTNIDPWSMPEWLLYRFFPEAATLDYQDFVPVVAFVDQMREAGFTNILVKRVDASVEERLGDFLQYASQRHRASQLVAIPDQAYEAGLRRLTAAAAATGDATVRSEFVLVTIAGDKAA